MATQTSTENINAVSSSTGVANTEDSSAELLRLALQGDRRAWEQVVRANTPMLRQCAYRFRIGDEANDAIQTTFLRLLEHGDCIRNPEALKAWLRTTLSNECLRIIRRRSRERTNYDNWAAADEIPLSTEQLPDEHLVRNEEFALLRGVIAELPARDRKLISLLNDARVEGYQAVSRQLGMPIGSIGPTRGRILVRMRESLRLVGLEDCA